ncbi:hypothetical protein LCGC14_0019260 [marine sediment metagenome]|uniref:Type II secretion system protein GspG C-terminal domain-containing protein n=1 Tax=marine sediment metagenome TaxID=412755 RepID=A0A0F9W534_9ZZZZ|nr:hypothetical protein [Phycisphaerae bacterium]HDZ42703.1 hypothetical protein [Phycisphaerae bacterium]
MPKRVKPKQRRTVWVICGLLVALAAIAHWPVVSPPTVSPQTTYVTGPLRSDGTVDYIAAVNQRLEARAAGKANAAALIIKALGPDAIWEMGSGRDPRAYDVLSDLGVAALPATGDYLLTLDRWSASQRILSQRERELLEQGEEIQAALAELITTGAPLSRFPLVSQWLEINRQPLSLLKEATTRPVYYAPMWTPSNRPDHMVYAHGVKLGPCEVAAQAFCVRALTHLTGGDAAAAWSELLACHRLARLVDQSFGSYEYRLALRIDAWAVRTELTIIAKGLAGEAELASLREQVGELRALRSFALVTGSDVRLELLDAVMVFRRWGELRDPAIFREGPVARAPRQLDWDYLLAAINVWWSKVAMADDEATYVEYLEARRHVGVEFRADRPDVDETSDGAFFEPSLAERLSRLGGRPFRRYPSRCWVVRMLGLPFGAQYSPRVKYDAHRAYVRLRKLAFELAEHKSDQGEFPATLDALGLDGAFDVLSDPFTGNPFIYKRTPQGYKLYSIGQNLTDDNGLNENDPMSDNGYPNGPDDIGIVVE